MKAPRSLSIRSLSIRAWGNIVLAGILIGASYWAITSFNGSDSAQAATRTAAVKRSTVLSTVSASGNLASTTDLSLGFPTSGTLTEINVKAGDLVSAGQILAKIDPATAQAAFDAANADLTAANEKLANLQSSATSTTTTATPRANPSSQAVSNAQQAAGNNAKQYQAAVDKAQKELDAANAALAAAQAAVVVAQGSDDSSAKSKAQQALFTAQNAQSSKQLGLSSAQLAQSTGAIRDQATISAAQASASASSSSNSSQSSGNTSTAVSSGDIATASAAVTTAQSNVTTAQANLNATTLKAPSAGTIASVTKAVGDTITTSSSGSSSTGTGTGSSTGSGTGGTGSAASSSTSSSTATTTFITMVDLNTYQVKAGFSESDAGKVKIGEAATITVDAANSQTFNAHVTAMDVTSTTVSNVVTYYALVTMDSPSTDLRPGMTATVSVVSSAKDDTLNVPTAAVQTGGGSNGTVTVMRDGKQTRTPVTTGLKGDDSTEILSGLREGDQVVIATATVSGASSANSNRTGNTGTANRTGAAGGGFTAGGGAPIGGPPGGF